ncbi:SH3 domain-containing protein [Mesobacillus subterraneus]|uniref:SH3 domain-containing protein n=1 Tax=Mesobacillus subterraneus TaxID=285983 RepID=UPI00203D77C4|nr:SH3 domain-containing protein [Mesobacillus subterraneus]MCM3663607.1 SH3 domain-containing protein [Mesobacillus subterraneus]MCM3683373.1 SH3 domain-containing protein [Mesobacillus subterraneus]
MKKYKKIIAASALSVGVGAGAILFTPAGMNASTNVVLASVDWVNSQLSPVNSKLSALESKVNSMQTKITSLESQNAAQQNEIDSLEAKIGSTTTPPPTTGTLPAYVYATKSSVTVHKGADRSYAVVATVTANSSLRVVDSFKAASGTWYRVQLSSTLLGWVYGGDVSTTKPTSTEKTVTTTGEVYIRRGATTEYAAITLVPKGTTLKYLGSFKNAAGETWYNVETSTGIRGWMFSGLGQVN